MLVILYLCYAKLIYALSMILNNLINISNYEGHTISFQTFLYRPFKIVVDTWKFTIL